MIGDVLGETDGVVELTAFTKDTLIKNHFYFRESRVFRFAVGSNSLCEHTRFMASSKWNI